ITSGRSSFWPSLPAQDHKHFRGRRGRRDRKARFQETRKTAERHATRKRRRPNTSDGRFAMCYLRKQTTGGMLAACFRWIREKQKRGHALTCTAARTPNLLFRRVRQQTSCFPPHRSTMARARS
ncbi:unnamed protein product, partial [Ixodes pacificus]